MADYKGPRRIQVVLLALALLIGVAPAEAKRVALVLGNDSYQHADPLNNARTDAKTVADALRATNFKVTLKLDVTLQAMKEALRTFKNTVSGGDEVIFYYSGHGVQLDGTNYMIPVDTAGENPDQIKDDSVSLQRVLDDMQDQKAKFTLVIIDACRDNPFKGNGRALRTRGLAAIPAPADGEAVLYSAGAGQEALDSLGPRDKDPNGVFTRVLIKEMRTPGLAFYQLIQDLQNQVKQLAKSVNQVQTPGYYSEFTGEFYFIPPSTAPVQAQSAPAQSAGSHVQTAAEREQSFWDRIRDSTDPIDFADYAKDFPQGPHAAEASLMFRKLQKRAAAAAPTPAPTPKPQTRQASTDSGTNQQAAALSGTSDAEPSWTQFEDPAEHAFRAQVPRGWKVAGGTYRFGTVDDPRLMVEMISPDGNTRLRVGDAGVPPYIVGNLALRMGGMREGSRYTANGAQAIVASYRNGWSFADLYGQARFAPFCRSLDLKQLRELPSVNANNGQLKLTSGEAIFRCESISGGGPMVGFVVAETQMSWYQGLQVWSVSPLYSVLAPENRAAAALKIILHAGATVEFNQQWAMYQFRQRGATADKAYQMYQAAVSQQSMLHQRLSAQFQQQVDGLREALGGVTLTSNIVDHRDREIWNGSNSNNIVSPMGAVASLTASSY